MVYARYSCSYTITRASSCGNVSGESLRAAEREGHVPAVQLPARRPIGELLGRPLLSGLGQRDEARSLGHPLENSRLVLHFPFLDPRIVAQALEVPVTGRAERRVSHAAYRDDAIAHQAYIPRSRCIAATRSTATM